MKKYYLLFIAAILMIAYACEKDALTIKDDLSVLGNEEVGQLGRDGKMVSVPIKFVGYTVIGAESNFNPGVCGDEYCFQNYQYGKGYASHLGKVDISFVFCVRLQEGCDQAYPGFPIQYNQNDGVIEAANGDKLYLGGDGVGKLYPTDRPGYFIEFQDRANIVGGTGRFEGATGYMITDSYNRGDTTDHVLTGILNYYKK